MIDENVSMIEAPDGYTPGSSLDFELKAFAKQLVRQFSLGAAGTRRASLWCLSRRMRRRARRGRTTRPRSSRESTRYRRTANPSISDGFALARELFADDGAGTRTDAAKIVLFFSDGEQTNDNVDNKTLFQTAVHAAQLVKDLPATVFAWGASETR